MGYWKNLNWRKSVRLQTFWKGIIFDKNDTRYKIKLPVIEFHDIIPDNFENCKWRFNSLKKKLVNNEHKMLRKVLQINSFNTSKNELIKIFRGFRVFECALWQKTKTRKCRKSTESFLNQKAPSVNGLPLLENC